MNRIGGNTTAIFQIKLSSGKNSIGENIDTWNNAVKVKGFLDYNAGQNDVNQYSAKLQDTTHFFFCDYNALEAVTDNWIWDTFNFDEDFITIVEGEEVSVKLTPENCRMVVNGKVYNVLLIDDPMGLHEHLEIYLQYVGGGIGVQCNF